MNNFLLESSVCLASFYGFYWLFLRNQKLLSINRIYLLLSSLISVIIPFLSIQVSLPFVKAEEQMASGVMNLPGQTVLLEQGTSNLVSILAIVYIAGLIVSIALLVNKLMGVKKKISRWPSLKSGQIEVIEIEGMEAFSFFNSVFIGKELNANQSLKDQIIRHELAHIDGKHSLDILLFELLKCIFWFNPISYLYAKSIRLQHEYIADQEVVAYTNAKRYERSLLRFTLSKIDNSLLSGFNEHPIQKRLKMIQQLNSNIMNKLKPLLALPILGTLLIAYACTDVAEPSLVDEFEEIAVDLNAKSETITEEVLDTVRTTKNVKFYFYNQSPKPEVLEVKLSGTLREIKEKMRTYGKDAILEMPDDMNATGDEVRVNVEKATEVIKERLQQVYENVQKKKN
uniref:M56 family metallopeptidase n=2 Tax=Roseivirga sp. TaxID=1964215 RepID=UPI004047E4AD